MDLFAFDRTYCRGEKSIIAGVDEAGRGPWAGPVVAAAVILPQDAVIPGLNDSKKLTPAKRDKLYDAVCASALSVGIGIADHTVIDSINILEATFSAMREALEKLTLLPELVLIDGCWTIPGIPLAQKAVVSGDAKSAAIAAASIIAKVTRDRLMTELAKTYPHYHFEKHKGYGTKDHMEALQSHGPCPIHRRSFAPIQKILEERNARQ